MNKEDLEGVLELHKKWLNDEADGKKADLSGANLRYADLSSADLSSANLRDADLSGANLSSANLRDANLRYADLRDANLRYADLSSADLSSANLRDADLSGANLSSANLRYADLSGADLSSANLRYADLSSANLSGANGLLSAIDYLESHFEKTTEGYIAYKIFNGSYTPSEKWVIQNGSVITENVNFDRAKECGCGINVATLGWVKKNYRGDIWKVLIKFEWLAGVCVPYRTDGKIRCERVQLLKVVK